MRHEEIKEEFEHKKFRLIQFFQNFNNPRAMDDVCIVRQHLNPLNIAPRNKRTKELFDIYGGFDKHNPKFADLFEMIQNDEDVKKLNTVFRRKTMLDDCKVIIRPNEDQWNRWYHQNVVLPSIISSSLKIDD